MCRFFFFLTALLLLLAGSACSTTNPPAATPTVTLAPGLGRVSGTLRVNSGGTAQPVPQTILYLAPTLKDQNGKEGLVAFERNASLKAVTDARGNFVFSNIPPGNYGLIYDRIVAYSLLSSPDSNNTLLISVSAEKETDLGALIYDNLPGTLTTPQPSPYP